jgi:hypothetical protein
MKRIETHVDLPAVPSMVWKHLTDTASVGTWNPFITSVWGVFAVGERLQVRIAPVGGRPISFKPRVTSLSRIVAWSGSEPWAFPDCSMAGTRSR